MVRRTPAFLSLTLVAVSALAAPRDSTDSVRPWEQATTWEITIARPDEPGPRFEMSGRVFKPDSTPAAGIKLYVYHADTHGWYARKQHEFNRIAGVLRTNDRGEYRIHSIMPGMYEGPGHVHFEVWDGAKPKLSTWVGLYAAPGVPPVPGWEHTASATHEWNPTMGLFTVDSSGVYHCHKDLRLNQMAPVDIRYDSLMKALRREDRGHSSSRGS